MVSLSESEIEGVYAIYYAWMIQLRIVAFVEARLEANPPSLLTIRRPEVDT